MRRIELPTTGAALDGYEPERLRAIVLVVPGGRCAARRYAWLAALTNFAIGVYVIDGAHAPEWASGATDGPSPMIMQMAEALAWLAKYHVPLHAIGHSAGAAAIFDALEPCANAAARLPESFSLPVTLSSVTSLGCALQSRTLDMAFPHRSDDRPLASPSATRVLFLAGDNDAIAPPSLVAQTAMRFVPGAEMVSLAGATHYGWAGPREEGDRIKFDVDSSLDTDAQRQRTLTYLVGAIAGRPLQVQLGDQVGPVALQASPDTSADNFGP